LTTTQLQGFSGSGISGLSATQIPVLTTDQIASLTDGQTKGFYYNFYYLSPSQIASISTPPNNGIGGLTSIALATVSNTRNGNKEQVQAFTADQIQWIPTSSIIGWSKLISATALEYITTTQISGFTVDQISALEDSITHFTTQVLASMTKAQANAITSKGLSGLYSFTPRTGYGIVTQIRSSI
jgi:hypothetical protein